jgi:putative endonuclease
MKYYAYILRSETHGTYYYGSSNDVSKRLKVHNAGKVRYTRGRRPWVLHYEEEFSTRAEAYQRERFFKSIEGHRYLKEQGII